MVFESKTHAKKDFRSISAPDCVRRYPCLIPTGIITLISKTHFALRLDVYEILNLLQDENPSLKILIS